MEETKNHEKKEGCCLSAGCRLSTHGLNIVKVLSAIVIVSALLAIGVSLGAHYNHSDGKECVYCSNSDKGETRSNKNFNNKGCQMNKQQPETIPMQDNDAACNNANCPLQKENNQLIQEDLPSTSDIPNSATPVIIDTLNQ